MHSVHHLELVNALAKYRHFGRAAEELGISQPALSKGLNHLESVLGVKLFDRAAPIAPTPFGDIVLQRSAALVHAFDELLREIELAKGVEFGSLAVAAGIYPSEMFIQEALAELSRQRPWIQCSLIVKDWAGVMEDVLTPAAISASPIPSMRVKIPNWRPSTYAWSCARCSAAPDIRSPNSKRLSWRICCNIRGWGRAFPSA